MILRLRVVENWKGKREVMVRSSGEKWEIGRWCDHWCASKRASNNECYVSVYIYIEREREREREREICL